MSVSPGSIHAGIGFLAWLFPATPLEQVTNLGLEELQAKYNRRDRGLSVVLTLAVVGLAVAYYFLLDFTADWYYRDVSGAAFLVRPSSFEWGVFAAFLSITSSTYLALLIFRGMIGRHEYQVYLAYAGHKAYPPAPYDVAKVFRLFFWAGFLPLVVVVVLRVDHSTAFLDTSVVDNPFWSLGRTEEHPYTAVHGVYEVRGYHARSEDIDAPFQVVVFADGGRWETTPGKGGLVLEHQREIIRYVARQSGLTVREVNFVEDIPP